MRGLVLMAPHFFMEDERLEAIRRRREAYETTDLRARLARHHADVDAAFRGWSGAWLDPGFRKFDTIDALAYIRVPILVVQGADDQYGTLRAGARGRARSATARSRRPSCCGVGHAPHREKPAETLAAVAAFADRLFRVHREGIENAA